MAFWSNQPDSGTTSNMAALSIACVIGYPNRIVLLENHLSNRSLEQYLFEHSGPELVREEVYYLGHGVSDCLIQQFSKSTNKNSAELSTIEVIEKSLYYVPQNTMHLDAFDYDFYCNMLPKLYRYQELGELTMIDTKNRNSISSKMILEQADLVVVSLKQDIREIEDFITNYESLIPKSIFLISKYKQKASLTIQKCCKYFNIEKSKISVVPYSAEYENALIRGRIVEFITSNFRCKKGHPNYYFITNLKKTAYLVIKNTICSEGILNRKE